MHGADGVIVNSTIYNNTSDNNAGGAVVYDTSYLSLFNTILAGNSVVTPAVVDSDIDVDLSSAINGSSSNNLIGYDPGSYFAPSGTNIRGTISAIDPRLAPLADYGGPTWVHVPYDDSAAIEAGDNAVAILWDLDFDQRGETRNEDNNYRLGDGVDIGAVELAFDEIHL